MFLFLLHALGGGSELDPGSGDPSSEPSAGWDASSAWLLRLVGWREKLDLQPSERLRLFSNSITGAHKGLLREESEKAEAAK